MDKFYLIGLTGNLGTGKSTVRRMLEEHGALGLDADQLAHAVMRRGTPAWNALIATFGTDILRFDGNVDRQKLGARVFGDAEALRQLEQITHPAVGELIRSILRETHSPVIVLEAVKLVQAGMHRWCDTLWVVTASPEVEVQRVMRDRKMREEDARARLAAQGELDERIRLADVVIDNSHDLSSTRQQVKEAWERTVHPEAARDKSEWLLGSTPVTGIQAPAPRIMALGPVEAPVNQLGTAQPPAPVVEDLANMPIEVRRARRGDLDSLALALARRENRTETLSRVDVLKRVGERGYRIAIGNNRIVALAAWEAENLVAMTRDLWAESPQIAPRALRPLIELVEQDAQTLVCEVSLILVGENTPPFIINEVQACGYQSRDLNNLHPYWRQVVQERVQPGDKIWIRRLREELVTKPI